MFMIVENVSIKEKYIKSVLINRYKTFVEVAECVKN